MDAQILGDLREAVVAGMLANDCGHPEHPLVLDVRSAEIARLRLRQAGWFIPYGKIVDARALVDTLTVLIEAQ